MAIFEAVNPRATVPCCLRCESMGIDVELDSSRSFSTVKDGSWEDPDVEPVDGFLCVDEKACRRRARARGLPDLNFCRACTMEIWAVSPTTGRRPGRCDFCEKRFRGEHLSNHCDFCREPLPSRAHLRHVGEKWVCRDVTACHRRRMLPLLRLIQGEAAQY